MVAYDTVLQALPTEVKAKHRPKSFGNLLTEVVKKNLCDSCAACAASCPVDVIAFKGDSEFPTLAGKCILCEYCYYNCPRTGTSRRELEEAAFGRTRTSEEEVGVLLEAHTARALKDEILKRASDGGVVTAILAYALEKGIIDSAVVSGLKPGEQWRPIPRVVDTYEDLLKAMGTRYSTSPTLLGLRSAVEEWDKERVAVVGVPCQIKAIRRMETSPYGIRKLTERTVLKIALFCYESLYHQALMTYLESKGVDLNRITKFSIREGKFRVRANGEEVLNVPIKELKDQFRPNCLQCIDFTGEYSDISVGSVGSPEGWSTVLIRTEQGKKIFQGAAEAGFIEFKPVENMKAVEKLSAVKKKRTDPAHRD
ncbi:Coenzyme F420 hydrogenase/dehydrogenase, beta subunit C-terminal domain [Candidatus Hecatella orcuttiae]|jgi:coenzyme F420 hydrogenase subunit beta|uniref:Coenzyme F420 hydrogenase/dehydrogenase, beta subunit C-terminal domain n=1 Tax=Candidatus Hecatella orcuttiae TaxID=1935119 RepID=UPI0028680D13|nr:Coenzyme F420 hydrogenase/dehydrogenase, beta subunit C-terminal domain [Candidatus Hecatella orcuttiae]